MSQQRLCCSKRHIHFTLKRFGGLKEDPGCGSFENERQRLNEKNIETSIGSQRAKKAKRIVSFGVGECVTRGRSGGGGGGGGKGDRVAVTGLQTFKKRD